MIQSMTGYGKATAELTEKKINVEIKSLNSKAMDLSARIAPAYREKEMEIRNEISRTLERGKVDFSLWVEKKESAESATPINQVLIEGYYKQIKDIADNLSIPVPVDWFQTLLRMPDVMTKTEIQELTEEEWETVHVAIEEAIKHLVDFRKQEGAALEKKFREKIANISHLLESITPYEKERVEKIKERITDALEKTLSVDYDKNRLEQELIYYIEKLDVNEEKQRLSNHLKYFISTMESGSGQGKKLGFIVPIRIWMADARYNQDVQRLFHSEIAEKFFDVDAINEIFDDYVGGNSDNWRKVWTIYTFLVWYEEYFVKR